MATWKPRGTCSVKIDFEVEGGVVTKCSFTRGCTGSLQALSKLVVNRPVNEVISMLEGIQCQNGTSCPDQLARALREYIKEK
jgi:uncharacterized protein (TIGR03905 family)